LRSGFELGLPSLYNPVHRMARFEILLIDQPYQPSGARIRRGAAKVVF